MHVYVHGKRNAPMPATLQLRLAHHADLQKQGRRATATGLIDQPWTGDAGGGGRPLLQTPTLKTTRPRVIYHSRPIEPQLVLLEVFASGHRGNRSQVVLLQKYGETIVAPTAGGCQERFLGRERCGKHCCCNHSGSTLHSTRDDGRARPTIPCIVEEESRGNFATILPLQYVHHETRLLRHESTTVQQYLAERHTSGRVDRGVEGDAILAPVLDDRNVGRRRARDAQARVDYGRHRSRVA